MRETSFLPNLKNTKVISTFTHEKKQKQKTKTVVGTL